MSISAPIVSALVVPFVWYLLALQSAGQEPANRRAAGEWMEVLRRSMPSAERLAERDDLAKRQAAIGLFGLGRPEVVWPLLRHSPDPSLRSYLIRDVGRSGVKAEPIVRRLEDETDVSARRALVLVLGELDDSQIPAPTRERLVPRLLRLYREDPDPGVHSAVDWLLRHGRRGLADRRIDWKQAEALSVIDRELTGPAPAGRGWFTTSEAHTLAIVRGPVEFTMGAPAYEPGRPKGDEEAQHRVRIPRSFAFCTKEVTVAQFQHFLDANPTIKAAAQADPSRSPLRGSRVLNKASPDEACPQVTMTCSKRPSTATG